MKKFLLLISVIFLSLLATAFLLPQEINAQKTDSECFREYQNKEYKCLQKFNDCTKLCTSLGSVEAYKPCANKCSAQDKTCSEQASVDLTACKAAIKKDNENPTGTKVSPEVETNTDCHEAFNKESNSCLKESTKCLNSCADKAYVAMSLTVDGGKVNLECQRNVCDPASKACNDKTMANFRACGKSDKQPTASAAKKDEPSLLKFFGINPYQGWLRLRETVEVAEFYASGELEESLEGGFLNLFGRKSTRQKDEETVKAQEKAKERAFESFYGKDWRKQIQQISQPKIDTKVETDAWSVPAPKVESVINVPGTTDTKRYSWDENSGAVVKSNDWEKIKFREPVEVGGLTSHTLELGEGTVEVKVRSNNPAENQFGVDAGWLSVTVSRTHFYVSKDPNGKFAVVGVYEGEVEVKTKDGKTIRVAPKDGESGVVVISQKLSLAKLAVVGVVLATTVGGVIFLLRKRFPSNSFKKKK